MKELLGAFNYLGINQFVSVVFGLIRSKIIALLLGPFGMGILNQGNALMELVRQIDSLGISNGFLKLISDYKAHKDEDRLGRTILTTVMLFGAIGVILLVASGLLVDKVSTWMFDAPDYHWFVLMGVGAGVLSAEYYALMTVFQGMLKWSEYALVSVVGYALNLVSMLILILFFRLWGAIISIVVAQAINVIVAMIVMHRMVLPEGMGSIFRYRPDISVIKEITQYIGPLSSLALIAAVVTIVIRSEMVQRLGVDSAGLFAVVYGVSLTYMGLIRNAFNAFGMNKITELLDEPGKMLRVQNDEIRFGVLLLCPVLLFAMITRNIWIPVFYSGEFLPAASLLLWWFIGDLTRTIRVAMNISLLPLDRLRFTLVDGIIDWVGWLVVSLVLLPSIGMEAITVGYLISGIAALIVAYFYHRSTTPFRIYKVNLVLLGKAAVLLLPGLFLAHYGHDLLTRWILPMIILVIMLIWMPSRTEYADLFQMVQKKLLNRFRKDA